MSQMGTSAVLNIANIATKSAGRILQSLKTSKVGHVLTPELAAHLRNANPQLFAEVAAGGGIGQAASDLIQGVTPEQIKETIEYVKEIRDSLQKAAPSAILRAPKFLKAAAAILSIGSTVLYGISPSGREDISKMLNAIKNIVWGKEIIPAPVGPVQGPQTAVEKYNQLVREAKALEEEYSSYNLDKIKRMDATTFKEFKTEIEPKLQKDIESKKLELIKIASTPEISNLNIVKLNPNEDNVIYDIYEPPNEPVAETAQAGSKQLFETDPLLFYLLNERPKNKKLKKAKLDTAITKAFTKAGARKKKLNEWQKYVEKYAAEHNIAFLAALKPASIQRKKDMKKAK